MLFRSRGSGLLTVVDLRLQVRPRQLAGAGERATSKMGRWRDRAGDWVSQYSTRQGIWGCKAIRWFEKQLNVNMRMGKSFRSCCEGTSVVGCDGSEWRVRVNFWRVPRSLGLQVDWCFPALFTKRARGKGQRHHRAASKPA